MIKLRTSKWIELLYTGNESIVRVYMVTNRIYSLSKDLFGRLKARQIPHTRIHTHTIHPLPYYVILLRSLLQNTYKQYRCLCVRIYCSLSLSLFRSNILRRKSQFRMSIYRPANRTSMSANLYICRCYRENHIRLNIPLSYFPLHTIRIIHTLS